MYAQLLHHAVFSMEEASISKLLKYPRCLDLHPAIGFPPTPTDAGAPTQLMLHPVEDSPRGQQKELVHFPRGKPPWHRDLCSEIASVCPHGSMPQESGLGKGLGFSDCCQACSFPRSYLLSPCPIAALFHPPFLPFSPPHPVLPLSSTYLGWQASPVPSLHKRLLQPLCWHSSKL